MPDTNPTQQLIDALKAEFTSTELHAIANTAEFFRSNRESRHWALLGKAARSAANYDEYRNGS